LLNENLEIVKEAKNPLQIRLVSLNNIKARTNINKIYFDKTNFKFDLDDLFVETF
jgi:hypothetical protein